MSSSAIRVTVRSAMVAVVTMAGSLLGLLLALDWLALIVSGMLARYDIGRYSIGLPPSPVELAAAIGTVILIPLLGGGLWGWGMARILNRPAGPALRTGAWSFGAMAILFFVPTGFIQRGAHPHFAWSPFDGHGLFPVAFAAVLGVIVFFATWRLVHLFDMGPSPGRVATWTALGAVVGFAIGALLTWRAATDMDPMTVSISNVPAMLAFANLAGTLTAGWVLGWWLSGKPGVEIPASTSDSTAMDNR